MKSVMLIDLDSKMPNLALMKLSAFHKKEGDKVSLNKVCSPDLVYLSSIFRENKPQALGILKFWKSMGAEVHGGGSGLDLCTVLPEEVEHIMPDYPLYHCSYSIGFTTRGCIRHCPFCIVPEKEGSLKEVAEVSEFWDPTQKRVVLFDNNILASTTWYKTLRFLQEHKLKVNFSQGIDIREIDKNKAEMIHQTSFWNRNFTHQALYFAWDLMEAEEAVIKGVQILNEAGIKTSLNCYLLTGFNTTFGEDNYRFRKLLELKVQPFVMIYNHRRDNLRLLHFARYVNRRIYKVCPDFDKYSRLRWTHA